MSLEIPVHSWSPGAPSPHCIAAPRHFYQILSAFCLWKESSQMKIQQDLGPSLMGTKAPGEILSTHFSKPQAALVLVCVRREFIMGLSSLQPWEALK